MEKNELRIAVEMGQFDTVKHLVRSGADILSVGRDAINKALSDGNIEMIRFLASENEKRKIRERKAPLRVF